MEEIKEALLKAMESYFQGDSKRINHAHRVTAYAEDLLEREKGDYPVVIGASVLHDIGIHQAELKYGSASGHYQEIEGPPLAREILAGLHFEPAQIEEICEIIAHHHSPGKIITQNFKILYDADWLVNLGEECDIRERNKLAKTIERMFLTPSGRTLVKEIYLGEVG